MKTIFLGPSGYNLDKKLLEGWDVKPPCKQSDIFKLPEGVVLDEEKIENLTRVFPLQYLSMFEQFSKYKQ